MYGSFFQMHMKRMLETKTQCSSDCSNCLSTLAWELLHIFWRNKRLSCNCLCYSHLSHRHAFLLLWEDCFQIWWPWPTSEPTHPSSFLHSTTMMTMLVLCIICMPRSNRKELDRIRACDSMHGKAKSNSRGCSKKQRSFQSCVISVLSPVSLSHDCKAKSCTLQGMSRNLGGNVASRS